MVRFRACICIGRTLLAMFFFYYFPPEFAFFLSNYNLDSFHGAISYNPKTLDPSLFRPQEAHLNSNGSLILIAFLKFLKNVLPGFVGGWMESLVWVRLLYILILMFQICPFIHFSLCVLRLSCYLFICLFYCTVFVFLYCKLPRFGPNLASVKLEFIHSLRDLQQTQPPHCLSQLQIIYEYCKFFKKIINPSNALTLQFAQIDYSSTQSL